MTLKSVSQVMGVASESGNLGKTRSWETRLEMHLELKGHTRAPDSEVTVKAMGVDEHAQGSLRIITTARKPTSLEAVRMPRRKGIWYLRGHQ